MMKTLSLVLALLPLLAGAQVNPGTVWLTKTGSRYHKAGCRYLKGREIRPATALLAAQGGLARCKVCWKVKVKVAGGRR